MIMERLGENMSAILAMSAMQYITMRNNAVMNMININNARMNLLCNPGGDTTGGIGCSAEGLCAMDTQMEIDALTNSLQYQYAKAMLEQIRLQQKEDAKKFSIFA